MKDIILLLARRGALWNEVLIQTTVFAKELESSQQTVSRKLIELENQGLLTRSVLKDGIRLKITDKGAKQLKSQYDILYKIFSGRDTIKGKYATGLGEGRYYVDIYNSRFNKEIGFTAYLGTLNVIVDPAELNEFLLNSKKGNIEGFQKSGRTFGTIKYYKVKIDRFDCAIVVPERTTHPNNTIEIISATNLSNKLKLKEGSVIRISNI